MKGSTRRYDAEQLRRISEVTIAHYDRLAEAYWDGTRDHDVNQNYAALDDQQNRLETKEDGGNVWSKRILAAIGAKYGTDSSEYEMVGGTRKSERKKPSKRGPVGGSTPKA